MRKRARWSGVEGPGGRGARGNKKNRGHVGLLTWKKINNNAWEEALLQFQTHLFLDHLHVDDRAQAAGLEGPLSSSLLDIFSFPLYMVQNSDLCSLCWSLGICPNFWLLPTYFLCIILWSGVSAFGCSRFMVLSAGLGIEKLKKKQNNIPLFYFIFLTYHSNNMSSLISVEFYFKLFFFILI
jgi:hypothetical protein